MHHGSLHFMVYEYIFLLLFLIALNDYKHKQYENIKPDEIQNN